MNSKELQKITEEFCDRYCKYPFICSKQDDLDAICEECPMNKLFELLD